MINPDTGKLRPGVEAILGLHLIADGDTKCPDIFINKQSEIVPDFVGKADHVPDIGHFIKCISSGLHKLAKENSHLRAIQLSKAACIKIICTNVSRVVREYGTQ